MKKEINDIQTECSCGHVVLKIEKDEIYTDNEVEELNLEKDKQYQYNMYFLMNKFYSKQEGILDIIKRRLKMIFYIIKGKEYLFEDMVLTQQQLNEFIKDLQELSK